MNHKRMIINNENDESGGIMLVKRFHREKKSGRITIEGDFEKVWGGQQPGHAVIDSRRDCFSCRPLSIEKEIGESPEISKETQWPVGEIVTSAEPLKL